MNIERVIFVFSRESDQLLKEINADRIELAVIKKSFRETEDDPNFYKPNKIEKLQHIEIAKYVKEIEFYPCSEFDLYFEAVSIK